VAIFADFTSIRNGKSEIVIPIEDSLKLGFLVADQTADSLRALDYEVVSSDKLFVGSYVVNKMAVADTRKSAFAKISPPFHIDPDVTHSKSYKESVLEAIRTFGAIAAGQGDKIKNGQINPIVAKTISAKYNSDAIVLIIGASRRVSGEPANDGIITSGKFYQLKMSHICIGIFHGFNGKLLWYGQKTFSSGQLDPAFDNGVRALLSEFPNKSKGPYFARPVK